MSGQWVIFAACFAFVASLVGGSVWLFWSIENPPPKKKTHRQWRAGIIRHCCAGMGPPHCDLCTGPVTPDNLTGWDEDGHLYCTCTGNPLAHPTPQGDTGQ